MVKKRYIRKLIKLLLNLVVIVVVIVPWDLLSTYRNNQVEAASHSITNQVDFESGYFTNAESKSKEGEIKIKPEITWNTRVFKTPKLGMSNQTPIVSDGNYIYALFNLDSYFARYIPSEDRWQQLANAPHMAYDGADMTVMGNYIYVIYGGYQKEFSRYSIIADAWEDLTSAPDLFVSGSSLVSDGTYLYASRGGWTSDFWKYDLSTNAWTALTNPPAALQQGSDMLYSNGALYVPRGYYQNFYKYDIATGTWSSLANIPADFYPMYGNHSMGINGDYIYFTRDYSSTTTFYRYKISDNTWESLTGLPYATASAGNVYNAADGYLYVFRGNGTYDFWKYDISANSFLGLADLPNAPTTGGDMIYHGDYLYYPRGGSQNFYRYNISSNAWETKSSTPASFSDDTKGTLAGSYLYFVRGSGSNNLYRYDPAGDSWTTMTATTPSTTGYGSTLVYPGTGDYMYATRGYLTRTFWRYQISTDTWSDPLVADLPDNAEAGYGSRMVSDGTDIYYISGHGISQILKYTVVSDTWTSLGNLPFAPFLGTDAAYYNGKIYFQAGYLKPDIWEYTISSGVWRWLGQMQTYGGTEISYYTGASLETDGSGYFYSNLGNSVYRMFGFTVEAHNYQSSGTWTSQPIDLSYVSDWTSLASSLSTPGDSTVTFETRTSADKTSWSGWSSVSGTTISSVAARYIEIKATMTASSDQSQTPIIYSLTINYTGDENIPSNPTSFTGKSQAVNGVVLTTGSSYSYHQPYFSWTGATDTETSIAGYYVYFGSNSSADPETSGYYQTVSTYTATLEMTTGITYYLRLKTKDTAGNISSAITGFTYTYTGVSPPQTITQTLSTDFSEGTTTDISTADDEIKLSSKSGFWQQERLSLMPSSVYYGSDFAYVSSTNKLYIFRGYNTTTFYEYDVATDVWSTKATTPEAVYYGSDLVEGPEGYLYGFKGNNSTKFWRYDIVANTWDDSVAVDLPQAVYTGGNLIYDGSRYIYATRGNADDAFYRYDTEGNIWEQMANIDFGGPSTQVNNVVSDGANMAYDGSDTIYLTQGARSGFASYSISANAWTVLTNTPVLIGVGSKIEYDSTSNSIYFFPGNQDAFFYRYDISTQSWVELTEIPMTIGGGSAMRNVNGSLYIARGQGGQNVYKYNIAKSSWLILILIYLAIGLEVHIA